MFKSPWVRVGAVIVVAAAVGLGLWVTLPPGSSAPLRASSSTTDVSARSLLALSTALSQPVYWAGQEHGVTYEFTETADQRTYVRYLPVGVAAGSPKQFLTVGTYPIANAFSVTRAAARQPGAVRLHVAGGGIAFYSRSRPTNVYVAFPGSGTQIEIFDPAAAALHRLVVAGRIRPVSGSASNATAVATKPIASSPAALKKLSSVLGHPIFWLGPIAGTRLELSHSPDGRVYVRYLPAGVRPGSSNPYLTVATYPLANAFAVTKAAAQKAGAVSVDVGAGGVAFFRPTHPMNVYVAFPRADQQIEVFDPSAGRARALVAANRTTPVF
jgi:hypothetical protein